ncbi:hypothetical protein GYMLUDRAFT_72573 [Collybiopsis luxurians FD-317 M1]|uniref:Uncharacterized protein n=1 Tax=Collybiopsis luxurians FD-317 M1 TaxID=944289 RepID=A0A0D0CJC4_9AGAR|nr:hypothetical protein GYMLUDRAFT_72573 [Collybiopsis luxurians FD-317 M1]
METAKTFFSNVETVTVVEPSTDQLQVPPTLHGVTATERIILRNVAALNSGESAADVTSPAVQEEAERLLTKNIADHASILRDNRMIIDGLKKAIAEQKEVMAKQEEAMAKQKVITASMEATLAVLEAVQGN